MCLLIVKKIGVESPSIENLKNGFDNNPDGAGIAFTKGDGYVSFRKFLTWKGFHDFLKEAEFSGKESKYSIMYHFRFATQGSTRIQNVHPFVVSEKLSDILRVEGKSPMVMAHNGVIGGLHSDEDISDTMIFTKDILANPKVKNNLKDNSIRLLLSKFLSGSKVAILNGTGKFTIINEESGHKKDGVWYSNHGYVKYTSILPTNTKVYKNGYSSYYPTSDYGYVTEPVNRVGYCDYCDAKCVISKIKPSGGMDLCEECREDMYYTSMAKILK